MEIRDLIRQKRIALGMTMKEVADKVGVSEGTISRWESGEIANMKRGAIASLAKVLQLSPNSIMGWDDDEQESAAPASDNLPDLTPKDEREITRMMDDMKEKLMQEEGLMFDGHPASPESIQSILDAMQIGMEMAKKRNKAKYTPKKYRHED
ncbi:helix-turn-helix domain-containing protein [Selenomonas artemidis]|uniref:helix-turn-helix domain-containing protein n=1 Tax=Selenomonas artemidis TaxID=671224 RepID=UPI00047CA4D8|nr:helix-turn-helix transcriptional regulator [Selenomonas artemidis]